MVIVTQPARQILPILPCLVLQVKSAPPAGSCIIIKASATSATRGKYLTPSYNAKKLDGKESVTIILKSLGTYESFTNQVSNSTTGSSNCTLTSAAPSCGIIVNVGAAFKKFNYNSTKQYSGLMTCSINSEYDTNNASQ